MNIPDPDEFTRSLDQLAWDHLNRIAYCGTEKPDQSLNIDPEALIAFVAIIGKNQRTHSNPRVVEEALTWGRNHQGILSKSRFKTIIDQYCEGKTDSQEFARCEEALQFVFGDSDSLEFLPAGSDHSFPRDYETREIRRSTQNNNRLYLRTLFANVPRAEVVNYLSLGAEANSHEIHRAIAVSQSHINDILIQLRHTGLVFAKEHGREIINVWQGNKLFPDPGEVFVNWLHVYDGLLKIHKQTTVSVTGELTEYQKNHIQNKIANVLVEKEKWPAVDFSSIDSLPDALIELAGEVYSP